MGDKIGYYNGKGISEMTREELLEVVQELIKLNLNLSQENRSIWF